MKNAVLIGLLAAAAVSAQIIETTPLRVMLRAPGDAANVANAPTGTGTVLVHAVRDNSGQITSATVDFSLYLNSAQSATITGLQIREGAPGSSGRVVVDTGINGSNSLPAGSGSSTLQTQITASAGQADGDATLQGIRGILQDPSRYYVDLQVAGGSGSFLQGWLQRAQKIVRMGIMRPEDEVPEQRQQPNAYGVGSIIMYSTRDAAGVLTSAEVIFDVEFNLANAATITGLHIHSGRPGVAGPVTIGTSISAANPVSVAAPGIGNIRSRVEVNLTNPNARATVEGLFWRPGDFYINLHTAALPAGIIRGQLRTTDRTVLRTALPNPSNPASPMAAALSVYTLRAPDATVQAGLVEFDVAPRFAGNTTINGLMLDVGSFGQVRPSISSLISPTSPFPLPTGSGHLSRFVTIPSILGTGDLDTLLGSPEFVALNLDTSAGPLRMPLAMPNMAPPQVGNVISAVSDPRLTTIAKGGLATIFGANFSALAQDLTSFQGHRIPWTLGGIGVIIGGFRAPILAISPGHIVVQVPFEVATGPQPVIIISSRGASTPFMTTVAEAAPGLYFGPEGAVATHLDYSLVSAQRPARADELIWVYGTGLGRTTAGPQLETGIAPEYQEGVSTGQVTATVGGRTAQVVSSLPSPGYVGLYQMLVRLPADLPAGVHPLTVTTGGATSNSVNLNVR